jgi:hypothetical protein
MTKEPAGHRLGSEQQSLMYIYISRKSAVVLSRPLDKTQDPYPEPIFFLDLLLGHPSSVIPTIRPICEESRHSSFFWMIFKKWAYGASLWPFLNSFRSRHHHFLTVGGFQKRTKDLLCLDSKSEISSFGTYLGRIERRTYHIPFWSPSTRFHC